MPKSFFTMRRVKLLSMAVLSASAAMSASATDLIGMYQQALANDAQFASARGAGRWSGKNAAGACAVDADRRARGQQYAQQQ